MKDGSISGVGLSCELLIQKKGAITTNEEVDKGTEKLEYMREAVVTIRRKDSDKFEGHSKGSTGWFNIDHEF